MSFNYEVILCSCNGSKYITEQLESILNQVILPCRFILSDDGSTDNTVSKVRNFISSYQSIELIIVEGPQKGPSINFLNSLKYSKLDYVFFSDQDDVWESDKIEKYIKAIHKFSKNSPQLYYSDALLVDEFLNSKNITHLQYLKVRPQINRNHLIIFCNYVQGATICLNSNLVELINEQIKETGFRDIVIHDWWCALLANYFGDLIFIDEPLIKYRQHPNNLIGLGNKFVFFDKVRSTLLMIKQGFKVLSIINKKILNKTRN